MTFRFSAAAAILIFAGASSAQIVTGPVLGSAGSLTCSVNSANPKAVRAGGYTELLGDIVITCRGGALLNPGTAVPTADITVAVNNTIVTSRVFPNGLSEALLMIDEPGATGVTGASGPGTQLPQTLCSGGALGAGAGGCTTYANTATSGIAAASTCTALSGGICASFGATPTMFQGVVNGNQVVFNGVPILAPVTGGLARVFRITNLRADAAQLAAGSAPFQGQLPLLASIGISGGVPAVNPVQTVGFIFDGLEASSGPRDAGNTAAGTSINIQPCGSAGLMPGAVLRFREGFGNAFKTRIEATATLGGPGTLANSQVVGSTFEQNVPGRINSNSESGFLLPVTGGVAGLTDFGTRLKATFNNVPAGVSIYVSTTNINPLGNGNIAINAGTNLGGIANTIAAGDFTGTNRLVAGLVTSESATAGPGQTLPLTTATNASGGVALFGPLPVDGNGTATAIWEVLVANPNGSELADFAVFYMQNGTPAAATGTVSLSMAPTTATPNGILSIPRFVPPATARTLISVAPCTANAAVGLTSTANPSAYGQTVTLTAAVAPVAPAAGTPTGTVIVRDGATTLRTLTLAAGQASFSTTLSTGTHSLTATYSGDGSFPSATSGTLTQTVNRAPTATGLSVGAGSASAGQTAAFTATVTSTAGTPAGSVTFRSGSSVVGTAALDGSGIARLSPALPIGGYSITATYNGDGNFAGSTSSALGFSVNAIATSVSTPALVSGTPTAGQALTFSATVSSDRAVTGTLTFRDGGATLGTVELGGSGSGAVTATLAAGNHSITASYGGDVFHSASSSAPLFLTVRSNTTMSLTSILNPFGGAVTFIAAVAATSSAVPTGAVTFTDGSVALGSANLNASGQAVWTVAAGLTAGSHAITATYAGDVNFVGSTATMTQVVDRPATVTALVETASRSGFSLTAAVTGAGGVPTGTAQFQNVTTGASLGSAALANGTATVVLAAPLPVGDTVRAVYSGDATFAGSSSAGQVFVAATNGFSFGVGFVADGLASLFGSGLADSVVRAADLPLPTTLSGVTVTIVDAAGAPHTALLYYVSPGQINFVMPGDVPEGAARLTVTTARGALTVGITITRAEPALASADGSGSGTAAAQVVRAHSDGTQEAPVTLTETPIAAGAAGDRLFLILYGTGLRHAAGLNCSLNGTTVPTLYVGAHAVYPGLDQVNLEVPAWMRGAIVVHCSAEGQASNTATVAVQ